MNEQSKDNLSEAIAFAEAVGPLPRCPHGSALKDGAGEVLEPPCGCRATADQSVCIKCFHFDTRDEQGFCQHQLPITGLDAEDTMPCGCKCAFPEVAPPVLHGKVGGEDRLLAEQCGFCGAMAGQPCVEVEFESVGTEVEAKAELENAAQNPDSQAGQSIKDSSESADLSFEAWWESQGLDGEAIRAGELDRWTLAKIAFDAGRASSCDTDSTWNEIPVQSGGNENGLYEAVRELFCSECGKKLSQADEWSECKTHARIRPLIADKRGQDTKAA